MGYDGNAVSHGRNTFDRSNIFVFIILTCTFSSSLDDCIVIVLISKNLGMLYTTVTMNDAVIHIIDVVFRIRRSGQTTAINRSMVTFKVASTEPTLAV